MKLFFETSIQARAFLSAVPLGLMLGVLLNLEACLPGWKALWDILLMLLCAAGLGLDRGRQLANLSSAGSRHRTAAVSLRRWLHPFENQSNFFSGKKRSGKEEKNVKFLFTLGRIFEIAGRI